MTLARFHDAQNQRIGNSSSYEIAALEMQQGHKTSHWIWYIFPQLTSLGYSQNAIYYGIQNIDEARDYLRDPTLFRRYNQLIEIVHQQLISGVPVNTLMGGDVDAKKLAASLTLFRGAAASLASKSEQAQAYRPLAESCDAILLISAQQGYPACQTTLSALDTYKDESQAQESKPSAQINERLTRSHGKQDPFSRHAATVVAELDSYIKLRDKEPSYFYQGLFKGYRKIDKIKAALALRLKLQPLTNLDSDLKTIIDKNHLNINDLLERDVHQDLPILDQGRLGVRLRRIAKAEDSNSWYNSTGEAQNYPRTVRGLIEYFLDMIKKFIKPTV